MLEPTGANGLQPPPLKSPFWRWRKRNEQCYARCSPVRRQFRSRSKGAETRPERSIRGNRMDVAGRSGGAAIGMNARLRAPALVGPKFPASHLRAKVYPDHCVTAWARDEGAPFLLVLLD